VERLHKTMRREFFRRHEREFATIAELQAALDGWVVDYNCHRPHQSLGMRPPADRFGLAQKVLPAAVADDPDLSDPDPSPAAAAEPTRPPGVSRWVDQAGQVSVAGSRYPVGRVFAGEPVEVVVAAGLVEILHAGVLVATHVQRRRPDAAGVDRHGVERRLVTHRRARRPGAGPSVVRVADANGAVSFAGVMYRAGRAWARRSIEVSLVAGSVQLACDGQVIRVHAARHDPAKEHGAFATPNGRPRKPKPAPGADHVAGLPNSIRRTGTGT
jgi:hypothetical protein